LTRFQSRIWHILAKYQKYLLVIPGYKSDTSGLGSKRNKLEKSLKTDLFRSSPIAGYQGYQPGIKDISRISMISAGYQGYQPDINAFCTRDILELSPLVKQHIFLGRTNQWVYRESIILLEQRCIRVCVVWWSNCCYSANAEFSIATAVTERTVMFVACGAQPFKLVCVGRGEDAVDVAESVAESDAESDAEPVGARHSNCEASP